MSSAAIDAGQLFELVWSAALAGVLVTTAFSLLILGIARASDLRRDRRQAHAAGYGALAIVAAVAVCASVIFGVSVIVSK